MRIYKDIWSAGVEIRRTGNQIHGQNDSFKPERACDRAAWISELKRSGRSSGSVSYTHLEAGIALAGTEVKSLRAGKCSIKESFIRVEKGEVYICLLYTSRCV